MRRRAWPLVGCLALLLGVGASAQHRRPSKTPPPPPQPPPDMSKPPSVGPVPAYQPPASQQDQLPNGLKIVVIEDDRYPLVTARLALAAGDSRLSPDQAGLDQAEADLLTAGTGTHDSLWIAQATAAMGGDLSAEAGPDFLTVSASALSEYAQPMIALMADVTLHPSFPQNEVELRKADMIQELAANRADAGFLAGVEFAKLLFGSHPYAITAPTDASIARIDRAALLRFHQEYFLPNNQAVIVITGDVNAAVAHNLAQQYFGDWQFGNPAPPASPPVAPPSTRHIALIDRPGSPQSTIVIGGLGITRQAPDYFPFLVANEVLGGSFNSRLVADVREQKGLAYDISSRNQPMLQLGSWGVNTQVRTAATAEAVQAILAELERMRAGPITDDELRQAKNYLSGNFVLSLETQGSLANQFLDQSIYGVGDDYLANWISRVQAVTAQQAEAAAEKYIHPDRELVVVVGDVKQIEAPLATLAGGPVTIYDDKGDITGTYPPQGTRGPTGRR